MCDHGAPVDKRSGRAEVDAAHIRPVEKNGPDIVSNGLALSGTAHWMFDRGLISLSDDLEILISRRINDQEGVRALINKTVAPVHRTGSLNGRTPISFSGIETTASSSETVRDRCQLHYAAHSTGEKRS